MVEGKILKEWIRKRFKQRFSDEPRRNAQFGAAGPGDFRMRWRLD